MKQIYKCTYCGHEDKHPIEFDRSKYDSTEEYRDGERLYDVLYNPTTIRGEGIDPKIYKILLIVQEDPCLCKDVTDDVKLFEEIDEWLSEKLNRQARYNYEY